MTTAVRKVECPKCELKFRIEVDYGAELVQRFTCPECGKQIPVIVMPADVEES